MSDDNERLEKEYPPEFSDEAIRRFLFGRLDAAEQVAFEEQLIADDHLEGRVRQAECELTDDYAFERLSENERELFEQRFLVSNGRQQMLRTSAALREHFATASDVTQTVSSRSHPVIASLAANRMRIGERLHKFLGLNQPVRKLVLAVVVLIVLMGTIWTVLRAPGVRTFITRRPKPAASPVTNQHEAHHATKAAPPVQEETPLPPDAHGPDVGQMLIPGNIYDPDRIPRVSVPGSEQATVRLPLAFNINAQESYRAELLTAAGQSLFSTGSFKPAGGSGPIEFEVPSHFLRAGDYQVKLRRVTNNSEEDVATYYFRAQ